MLSQLECRGILSRDFLTKVLRLNLGTPIANACKLMKFSHSSGNFVEKLMNEIKCLWLYDRDRDP